MKILKIQGTSNTPKIELNAEQDYLFFSGESRPDNIKQFFEPVFHWLNDYSLDLKKQLLSQELKTITIEFKMEYFNSSTIKVFAEILSILKALSNQNPFIKLQIKWHFETSDRDMKEAGEEFSDFIELPFLFVAH